MSRIAGMRPSSLGDVLDRAIDLCRRNLLFFVATCLPGFALSYLIQKIVFIVSHPGLSLKSIQAGSVEAFESTSASMVVQPVSWLVLLLVAAWTDASLIRSIADRYLGNPSSLDRSLRAGLSRMVPVGIASLLYSLMVGAGFILFLVPGFLFMIWFCLYQPAAVIEGKGPIECLRRSFRLMRATPPGKQPPKQVDRQSFQYVVILHVRAALMAGISGFAAIPAALFALGLVLAGWFDDPFALVMKWTPLDVLVILGEAVIRPFFLSILVLFYYNVRMRLEGLDLDLRAQVLAAARPRLAAAGEPRP